jgi:hypothetical protein
MSRPKKNRVDYFPHSCKHGRTMFVLEQKFGNDGYAFWFKLLELLGQSDGHSFYCRNPSDWEFLQAITRLDGETCTEILNLLAKLEAIDPELWQNGVIWSKNFVEGIAEVYVNRRVETPAKPSFYRENPPREGVSTVETIENPPRAGVSTGENPQSKVEESITPPTPPPGENGAGDFFKWVKGYPLSRRKDLVEAEREWGRLKRQGRLRPLGEMLQVLALQCKSAEWEREEGRYIPLPHRYLKLGRFVDASVSPAREPPRGCGKCRGTGFRKAKAGEEALGGMLRCECKSNQEVRGP